MDIAAILAEHVVATGYKCLPGNVVRATKDLIADTIGCCIAGNHVPGGESAALLAIEWGGKQESTILGYDTKVPAPNAAFANASMAHSLDFDDTHDINGLHPSAPTLFAALAMAERLGGVSGEALVTAVAVGLDICCRMSLATRNAIETLGWFITSTYGTFGAAAAAGKVANLDQEKMLHCLGIAYSQAAGNVQVVPDGGLVKRIQPGFAARGGVSSVELVQRGVTGARNVLLGKYGFYNLYERGNVKPDEIVADLGIRFEGARLSLKPYTCCRGLHSVVDAAIYLRQENRIDNKEIAKIEVCVSDLAHEWFTHKNEGKRDQSVDAQFSLPYAVATGIVKGKMGLEALTPEGLTDPAVTETVEKVVPLADGTLDLEKRGVMAPAVVRVYMKDGRTFSRREEVGRGHPDKPMSASERFEKFHACTSAATEESALSRLWDRLDRLEELRDVRELATLIASRCTGC